ncbi:hypothetical protein V8G54_034803 [Vigna mungo]|uniref:Uncharacterized protein n=1 Tax=Vigna mungo TaxID=3915 RepID=A0AAQ3MDT6_VIGMU
MNLDLVLPNKCSLNEEVRNVFALITLELDNLAKLLVMHNIAIAAELFLQVFQNLLIAELFPQTLHCRQTLLPIPLLYTNMHILLRPGGISIFSLSKWVETVTCYLKNTHFNHIYIFTCNKKPVRKRKTCKESKSELRRIGSGLLYIYI